MATIHKNNQLISVIIPTLNAAHYIEPLLNRLEAQTLLPYEILIIDSQSIDKTNEIVQNYQLSHDNVKWLSIPRSSFNHGSTRNFAVSKTIGSFILFLTQDALPASSMYIEHLLRPFKDPLVAQVSGRQLPRASAKPYEKEVRLFNYPAQSNIRDAHSISQLGVKAFFATDACSAYRRDLFNRVGGFPAPVATNEDMLIAAQFLNHGYKVAYEASATVIHSHNLSLRAEFRRNKLIGKEMRLHTDLLHHVASGGEGMRMVRTVSKQLLRNGHPLSCLYFWLDCASRLSGNIIGKLEASTELKKKRNNCNLTHRGAE